MTRYEIKLLNLPYGSLLEILPSAAKSAILEHIKTPVTHDTKTYPLFFGISNE